MLTGYFGGPRGYQGVTPGAPSRTVLSVIVGSLER